MSIQGEACHFSWSLRFCPPWQIAQIFCVLYIVYSCRWVALHGRSCKCPIVSTINIHRCSCLSFNNVARMWVLSSGKNQVKRELKPQGIPGRTGGAVVGRDGNQCLSEEVLNGLQKHVWTGQESMGQGLQRAPSHLIKGFEIWRVAPSRGVEVRL